MSLALSYIASHTLFNKNSIIILINHFYLFVILFISKKNYKKTDGSLIKQMICLIGLRYQYKVIIALNYVQEIINGFYKKGCILMIHRKDMHPLNGFN